MVSVEDFFLEKRDFLIPMSLLELYICEADDDVFPAGITYTRVS